MNYKVKELADLAGVSPRTLRYYDQIDLLKPSLINESGYRIYSEKEVDLLQQILFYRELGVDLQTIKQIINKPSFKKEEALKEHRNHLLKKREQLDLLIENVEKSIAQTEGKIIMTDKEKFSGFKKQQIKENERKYGQEIREKYGEATVDAANKKFLEISEEEFKTAEATEQEIIRLLQEAVGVFEPTSIAGEKIAALHKKWLEFYWPEYSKEAHASLAEIYVADERFKEYYEKYKVGASEFLKEAILHFVK